MVAHYHAMNGSSGCIPDNNEVHEGMSEAITSLVELFSEQLTRGEEDDMVINLRASGIHHFRNPRTAGADYAEVTTCNSPDCLSEDN